MFWKSNGQCYNAVVYVSYLLLVWVFFLEKINLPSWSYCSEAHLAIYNKPVSMSVCLCIQVLAGVEGPSQAYLLLSQVTALYHAWYQLMKFHVKKWGKVFSLVIFMQSLPQSRFSWSLWPCFLIPKHISVWLLPIAVPTLSLHSSFLPSYNSSLVYLQRVITSLSMSFAAEPASYNIRSLWGGTNSPKHSHLTPGT